ncbi:MAG: PQQ-binding-like beta-propeller repeat protein [Bacteroidales bacterium]|nr:PQQ-binding-like beta-propeller repeat protein [Bacteroidales bacterium]
MKRLFLFFVVISSCSLILFNACQQTRKATPNDWPQFKKDNYRSGVTPVAIFDNTFGLKWVYRAPQVPAPAWYGPAREDAYALSGPLPSMRDYDLAYSPVIVRDKWYYGSTSDDAVHCLSTKTGREEWIFITNGPVRIAPTYYKGNLYFGSDDGYVYCIRATSGKLKWKFSPSKSEQKLLNNGRLISFWPVRTGVMIEDNIAYFGASLIPWKKSWLCAVDAETGKVKGRQGTYVREAENVTFEGSMASSGDRLIQPQGRISPVFIDRRTGKIEGQLPGAGGCFVLVTPDKHIVHPETSRFKEIVDLQVDRKKPEYMSFKGGKEMVVSGDKSYVLSDHAISAYNRKTKEVLWVNKTYHAHRIIMADTVLFAGATDTVYAVSVTSGQPLWQGNVEGTVYAMAAGDSALFVSTGEGKIYCFARGGNETTGAKNKQVKGWKDPREEESRPLEFPLGPVVDIRDKHHIAIDFTTAKPTLCTLYWHSNNNIEKAVYKDPSPALQHHFEIPVRKDFVYSYRIEENGKMTKAYEYDNFFNYSVPGIKVAASWLSDKKINVYVDNLIKSSGIHKGLCLVLSMGSGQLPVALAQKTELDVIVLDGSSQKVQGFRKKLEKEGVYGRRLSAYTIQDFRNIPIQSDLADLVICNGNEYPADEVIRLTAPHGKAVYMKGKEKEKLIKQFTQQTRNANNLWQVTKDIVKVNESYIFILSKKEPASGGVWISEYGKPDNSAYGGASMWGTTSSEEFEIQWMGRPGPRFQADRNGRKPSPLAINGKLFVQGKERIAAIDAYNGTIVWTKWIPGFIRMNVVRDCSNWAADEKYIYAVKKEKLLVINQQNGSILTEVRVPGYPTGKYDWGYVGTYVGAPTGMVVGSAIPSHSAFVSFYGGWGWYDATHGPETDKVMSYNLFAIPAGGGKILWKYEHKPSMIINSTITLYDGKAFFVESATPKLTDKKRGGEHIFDKTYLVALDLNDGSLLWRKALDNKPGVSAYFMAAGRDRLVIVSSLKGTYYLYNYGVKNGSLKWKNGMPWPSDNHGGHLSQPAIVGNRLMLKPGLFRMDTGERLNYDVPKAGHGCASYALSEQSVFYRGGSVTQFNFDTRKFSKWERLRPDCWISTIPALGMVLSPEGGGGCSCGNWYETSMVMAPKSRAPVMFSFDGDSRFTDTLRVGLVLKKGVKGKLYYTLDGSMPDKNASPYSRPVLLDKNTELRVALYLSRGGREIKMIRSRYFERLRPAPVIEPQNTLKKGKRTILLKRVGHTGTIHYTLDGSIPDHRSPVYTHRIVIDKPVTVKAVTLWKDKKGRPFKSKVTTLSVPIPEVIPAVKATVNPGLVVNYYEGEWKQVPDFDHMKSMKTAVVKEISLDPARKTEHFGLLFTGYIRIPEDGIYKFYLTSDDGSNLYIHGRKIINNDGTHGIREKMGQIPLQAGLHPVRIEFFQTVTSVTLSLKWAGPSFGKENVPAVILFH